MGRGGGGRKENSVDLTSYMYLSEPSGSTSVGGGVTRCHSMILAHCPSISGVILTITVSFLLLAGIPVSTFR